MKEFEGRTAVITGGASGIGLATAERLAAEGMNLVLADIEARALTTQVERLETAGHQVLGVVTDVADSESVKSLAAAATARFGNIHILFNNAGVTGGGPILRADDLEMWDWTLGVNLYGVLNGIKAFGNAMIEHGEPCHIVNTASMAGLLPTPGLASYTVSKYGVVAISETLALETAGSSMCVSVLCPGFVQTQIADSDRNLPEHLVDALEEPTAEVELLRAAMREMVSGGIPPTEVADIVFDGIVHERFVLLPHPQFAPQVVARSEALVAGDQPSSWAF